MHYPLIRTQTRGRRPLVSPSDPYETAIIKKIQRQRYKVITFCIAVFFLFISIVLFARLYLVVATVVSQSMSPTLEIGDRVLGLRHWPAHWLRKGQIVLFWLPDNRNSSLEDLSEESPLIKRVIGLPGDKVVNDYLISLEINDSSNNELTVPPGYLFVRGDLQIVGNDSFTFGLIPFENLFALVLLKLPRREDDSSLSDEVESGSSMSRLS